MCWSTKSVYIFWLNRWCLNYDDILYQEPKSCRRQRRSMQLGSMVIQITLRIFKSFLIRFSITMQNTFHIWKLFSINLDEFGSWWHLAGSESCMLLRRLIGSCLYACMSCILFAAHRMHNISFSVLHLLLLVFMWWFVQWPLEHPSVVGWHYTREQNY